MTPQITSSLHDCAYFADDIRNFGFDELPIEDSFDPP